MPDLALLEADMLDALEAAARPATAPQLALACKLEVPRTVSILTTLRRFGLAEVYASGLGVDTRWRITDAGRDARRRHADRNRRAA